MKGRKIVLSPDQERYIIDNFGNTKNDDMAAELGISSRALVRIARRHGLHKTKEFRQRVQLEASAEGAKWYATHKVKPGFYIPGGEKYYFKKGESTADRYGEERAKEIYAKIAAKRNATLKAERRRALFGIPQKTKLKIYPQSDKRIKQRWYLKKNGYTIDDDKRIAYYDESTHRCLRLEQKQPAIYKFVNKNDI